MAATPTPSNSPNSINILEEKCNGNTDNRLKQTVYNIHRSNQLIRTICHNLKVMRTLTEFQWLITQLIISIRAI